MIPVNKKVYDENCVYQLKDKTLVVLDGFNGESFKVSRIDAPENFWFETEIFECSSVIAYGKVSDAPIELIDGQIYMFDVGVVISEAIGRYSVAVTGEKMFTLVGCDRPVKVSNCKNIIRLVPEAK